MQIRDSEIDELQGPRGTAAPRLVPARSDQDDDLMPYQAAWPARYRVEAEVLRAALRGHSPVIEHVGSTAIPGLAAMPVIDLMLGLSDPVSVDAQAARLANFGYRLLVDDAHRAPDRRVLTRHVRGVLTHQVHVVPAFGDAWHRLLMFRDLLRLDRDLALAYESLKRELARQTRGRPLAYATGKADFIASVLGRPAFAPAPAPAH